MNVKPMQPLLQGYHRSARSLGSGLGPAKPNKYYKMEHKRASDGDADAADPSSGEHAMMVQLVHCLNN